MIITMRADVNVEAFVAFRVLDKGPSVNEKALFFNEVLCLSRKKTP